MTWSEMMEILDWMTPRWVEVGRWSDERIYAWFEDLEAWPVDSIRTAVKTIYEDGGKAPNGGQVIRSARALGFVPEIGELVHSHTWAILEYEDDRDDGRRLGRCVWRSGGVNGDLCGEERTFDPGELLNQSEVEAAVAS